MRRRMVWPAGKRADKSFNSHPGGPHQAADFQTLLPVEPVYYCWQSAELFCWNQTCYLSGMHSIALVGFENAEKNVAPKVDELTQIERLDQPRRWVAFVLPVFALLLWLAAGCLLTWLVADF